MNKWRGFKNNNLIYLSWKLYVLLKTVTESKKFGRSKAIIFMGYRVVFTWHTHALANIWLWYIVMRWRKSIKPLAFQCFRNLLSSLWPTRQITWSLSGELKHILLLGFFFMSATGSYYNKILIKFFFYKWSFGDFNLRTNICHRSTVLIKMVHTV